MADISLDLLKKQIDHFRDECMKLRRVYNTQKILFESTTEISSAIYVTARHFFNDLNEWLIELLYLQSCRITDPRWSSGFENLSAATIVGKLTEAALTSDTINQQLVKLQEYRKLIVDVRRKVYAHLDLQTITKGAVLGAREEIADEEFFENIQLFCDEVASAVGLGPIDFRTQAGDGDVYNLIVHLERGIVKD